MGRNSFTGLAEAAGSLQCPEEVRKGRQRMGITFPRSLAAPGKREREDSS